MDNSLDLPSYAHPHDAAFDLRASHDCVLRPNEHALVRTGLKFAIPEGHVGLIWDRSGLAVKNKITTLGGVIDAGFRGEIAVIMMNLANEDFKVEKGMRVAQMIVQPFVSCNIEETESLDDTHRGEKGMGSTGLH